MSPADLLGPALLARARNAIGTEFGLPPRDEPFHPELSRFGATFVTLHHGHNLRGCIGTLEAVRRLEDDVRHCARAAAFADPRFEPLRIDEFSGVCIEVSVLGTPVPLRVRSEADALAALRPFADGVILRWRGNNATLLPQVWKSLPEPREFLRVLRRKAGLPADFWADDLELSRYSVVHYEEAAAVLEELEAAVREGTQQ